MFSVDLRSFSEEQKENMLHNIKMYLNDGANEETNLDRYLILIKNKIIECAYYVGEGEDKYYKVNILFWVFNHEIIFTERKYNSWEELYESIYTNSMVGSDEILSGEVSILELTLSNGKIMNITK